MHKCDEIEHGLFFIDDKLCITSVDRACELKLTTDKEVFDLYQSLDMEYEIFDKEVYSAYEN